jgi:hypothetical protein
MVLAAVGTNWGGTTVGRNVIELLTVGTLRWDNSTLIGFNCYFDVTQLFQLGNLKALGDVVQVNNMHGKRRTISPGRHGSNILDTKAQGYQFLLNCVGGVKGGMPLMTTLCGLVALWRMRLKGTFLCLRKVWRFK